MQNLKMTKKNDVSSQEEIIERDGQTVALFKSSGSRVIRPLRYVSLLWRKTRDVLAIGRRQFQHTPLPVLSKKALSVLRTEGWRGLKARVRQQHSLASQAPVIESSAICDKTEILRLLPLASEINSVSEGSAPGSIWDNSQEQFCNNGFKLYWECLPEVAKYQLKAITGKDNLHYLNDTIDFVKKNIGTRNLRGLFIGCQEGDPPPEWSFIESGLFNRIEVFDIAEGLIRKQEKLAMERGITNVEYSVRDCNTVQLDEGVYDLILAVGTIHHIEKLDSLFNQINGGLTSPGIFVMREYVGPSRFQFTEKQVSLINEILSILPEKYKRTNKGFLKNIFTAPDPEDVIKVDPSEAICSQDILRVLHDHLNVIKLNHTGGTILHPLLSDIAENFERDEDADAILKLLILFEKTLIDKKILPSDYVFSIAGKK